jgi:hypothetical protein
LLLQAVLNIISNPVNSTVPIAAEALKRMGVYDKRKLLGVTTLDVVRRGAWAALLPMGRGQWGTSLLLSCDAWGVWC